MSQQVTRSAPRSASGVKPLPPAVLRPPAPPWVKLIAWLVLLLCLILLAVRGPLLGWAEAQPLVPLPLPGKPLSEMQAGPQGPTRLLAIVGVLVRGVLLPPGVALVEGLAALGLVIIGLELCVAALLLVLQTAVMGWQGRLALLVRIPNRPTARVYETGADLFRALHRQLPTPNLWLGQAPWLTLTLGARPDEPVELGVVVAGGTAKQRASWAAAIRKTVQGLAPDAVVEVRPDPLAAALTSRRVATWTEWRPALPPVYPLRLHDDREAASLFGPLVAALQPRQGVAYTEVQLALRPRPDDTHLGRGWRAAGTRRLLRLMGKHEYALSPDARALEAKLAGPTYDATLRAVSVAAGQGQLAEAQAELDELHAVIGQYAARSGSRLQRWVRGANGTAKHTARRWWNQWGVGAVLPAQLGTLVGVGMWFLPLPLLSQRTLPLVVLLGAMSAALAKRLMGLHAHQRLRRLCARPLRATPLPGLLWGQAWRGPAILGTDELAGLWHLPTPAQGRLVRWLPSVYLPPPPHAFCEASAPAVQTPVLLRRVWALFARDATEPAAATPTRSAPARLVIGYGRHRDDSEAPARGSPSPPRPASARLSSPPTWPTSCAPAATP